MSTRCNIYIYDKRTDDDLWLYHHFDGYPEGVGEELKNFLSLNNNRILSPSEIFDGLVYTYGDEYEETEGIHGDIDYFYKIEISPDLTKLYIMSGSLKKITEYDYPHNSVIQENNSYTVNELKNAAVELEYLDTIDLLDSGILDNLSKNYTLDEQTLRNKIIEKVKERLNDNLAIEIIDKK